MTIDGVSPALPTDPQCLPAALRQRNYDRHPPNIQRMLQYCNSYKIERGSLVISGKELCELVLGCADLFELKDCVNDPVVADMFKSYGLNLNLRIFELTEKEIASCSKLSSATSPGLSSVRR